MQGQDMGSPTSTSAFALVNNHEVSCSFKFTGCGFVLHRYFSRPTLTTLEMLSSTLQHFGWKPSFLLFLTWILFESQSRASLDWLYVMFLILVPRISRCQLSVIRHVLSFPKGMTESANAYKAVLARLSSDANFSSFSCLKVVFLQHEPFSYINEQLWFKLSKYSYVAVCCSYYFVILSCHMLVIEVFVSLEVVYVAACCSMLHCVVVCCSVLQNVTESRIVLLQCVAVCCSVLQCVAVCCSMSQCVAVWCSVCCRVLQCVAATIMILSYCFLVMRAFITLEVVNAAVCCGVLQCVAVCCSYYFVIPRYYILVIRAPFTLEVVCAALCYSVLQCVAVCGSELHCVALCCIVLQRVAVCCSVLQCVAVCSSVQQCVAAYCSVLQSVAATISWSLLTLSLSCEPSLLLM